MLLLLVIQKLMHSDDNLEATANDLVHKLTLEVRLTHIATGLLCVVETHFVDPDIL